MLITDLDHLKLVDTADVLGGNHTNNTLSLSIINGSLSLKLGETVLLEQAIALPETILFTLENAAFLHSSSTVQNVNGVTSTTYSLSAYPPSAASQSLWEFFNPYQPPF